MKLGRWIRIGRAVEVVNRELPKEEQLSRWVLLQRLRELDGGNGRILRRMRPSSKGSPLVVNVTALAATLVTQANVNQVSELDNVVSRIVRLEKMVRRTKRDITDANRKLAAIMR